MEKKYYFRGLGLGIIVTAIIMGISLSGGSKKREMTDDEVIARAKELGMIEDSNLLDLSGQEGEAEEEQEAEKAQPPAKADSTAAERQEQPAGEGQESMEQTDQKQDSPEQTDKKQQAQGEEKPVVGTPEAKSSEPSGSAVSVPEKPQADTNEMTKQDEDVPKSDTGAVKSVTIASGDGSYTVARKLAEAGVISSADSYDDFLCKNGYDKKLRPGTFQIPAGAGDEQIARIVTGQE